ncbi:LysR family transcriptional regulator [Chromobacterium violaceum]|uniref:LysR family transcriptional regulator n=1 Tax=Chromobacterium violaceum TaxID=536 RepID=UPI0009D9AC42|nr:LysR family transcriptional regulator [Chromobacterium violaceum]OQS50170.1 LysR family transcriptional regulator [Chromobacterium violaceum]OQS52521.1 LysR family transcriptional regulator [Chromobacterium violaceum]QRO32697.1 LysR family transcriptional regulator [Chromobacterium violaceum]QRQ17502.1 LysR family transcriptional regulator [Chromobacterium violaceum]
MSISLRHIEVFRAVMTCGSVSGAARLLHTSQPTVSRELARCEQLLGMALFERGHGRLRPTQQALQLFAEVERSFVGLERIVASADAIRQFAGGQLAVACLPVFAQALLPGVCADFVADFPDVGVDISPQESPWLEEWLAAQRFDLGLTEQQQAPAGCQTQPLWQGDELCVLPAGHPLAEKRRLEARDFDGLSFISLAASDSYRQQVDAWLAREGVSRRLQLSCHSAASVCEMVRLGLGVAIVNPLTALAEAERGLAVRPLAESIPFSVQLVLPQFRPASPLPARFIAALRRRVSELDIRLSALRG